MYARIKHTPNFSWQMYPCLMVVGGIVTLASDNRHRLIAPITSRFPFKRSPPATAQTDLQAQEDPEEIELSGRSPLSRSRSTDKRSDDTPISPSANNVKPEVTDSVVHDPISYSSGALHPHSSTSGVHQRRSSSPSPSTHARPDTDEMTPLLTLGTKAALAMALTFVAIVVAFIVLKSTVTTLGRPFNVSDGSWEI